MAKFVVCDQSLKVVGGHYYEYSHAVATAAANAGYAAIVLANVALDSRILTSSQPSASSVAIVPWFTFAWHDQEPPYSQHPVPGTFSFELQRAITHFQLESTDHILIHTIGWPQTSRLLKVLSELTNWTARDWPKIHLLQRFPLEWLGQNDKEQLRVYFKTIKHRSYLAQKIKFYSDTDPLSNSLTEAFHHTFCTLPIPFAQDALIQHLEKAQEQAWPPERAIRIAYLGDARREKGYHLLPDLVRSFSPTAGRTPDVQFLIQSNIQESAAVTSLVEVRAQLRSLHNVTLIDEALPSDEYYAAIARSDIILVAYDPHEYRCRSSGILVEALAAGKVVVTSRGSWMETQVSPDSAVVFDYPNGLAASVRAAVESCAPYSQRAMGRAAEHLRRSTPGYFVSALLSESCSRDDECVQRPHILFVMDGDAIILRNGASRVAWTQLDYLFRCGYDVSGVFISMDANRSFVEQFDWQQQLASELRDYPFLNLFGIGFSPDFSKSAAALYVWAAERANEHSLRRDLSFMECLGLPVRLQSFLALRPADAVFLNHIVARQVIVDLGLSKVPTVCEIHDIQSFQKAIYGQRAVDPREVDFEIQLLDQVDEILCLSATEFQFVRQRVSRAKVSHIPLTAIGADLSSVPCAECRDLADLIAACQPEGNRPVEILVPPTKELSKQTKVDLLFVSSNHLSNVSGLRWFLEEVYEPHLAPIGFSLVVAGSVADAFEWKGVGSVTFTGRVRSLDPLYAAASLIVLPILEGAGSPVKTIEALSMGKPVVGTSHAFRGLVADYTGIPVHDDAKQFASEVVRLLGDRELRAAVAKRCFELAMATSTIAQYDVSLTEVFRRVLLERAVKPTPAPLPQFRGLHEWDGAKVAVTQLWQCWTQGLPLSPKDCEIVRRLLLDSESRPAWIDQIWSSLFTERQVVETGSGGSKQWGVLEGAFQARAAALVATIMSLGHCPILRPTYSQCSTANNVDSFAMPAGALAYVELVIDWRSRSYLEIDVAAFETNSPSVKCELLDGQVTYSSRSVRNGMTTISYELIPSSASPVVRLTTLLLQAPQTTLVHAINLRQCFDISDNQESRSALKLISNWHGSELQGSRWARWTGPELHFTLSIDLISMPGAVLQMGIVNHSLGKRITEITAKVDGHAAEVTLRNHPTFPLLLEINIGGRSAENDFVPHHSRAVEIQIPEAFSGGGSDKRILGLLVADVCLLTPIAATPHNVV